MATDQFSLPAALADVSELEPLPSTPTGIHDRVLFRCIPNAKKVQPTSRHRLSGVPMRSNPEQNDLLYPKRGRLVIATTPEKLSCLGAQIRPRVAANSSPHHGGTPKGKTQLRNLSEGEEGGINLIDERRPETAWNDGAQIWRHDWRKREKRGCLLFRPHCRCLLAVVLFLAMVGPRLAVALSSENGVGLVCLHIWKAEYLFMRATTTFSILLN
jgi:hypothetical protein